MKRDHQFNQASHLTPQEINTNVAIHEAGHAAAIYLRNKQKGLPPIYFQILITPVGTDEQSVKYLKMPDHPIIAKVDGGRLIHTLPSSIQAATVDFSPAQTMAYQRAFEADMINLLVGPLAEANYIALQDGEILTHCLVNLNALQNYGGCYDLDNFYNYLDCFVDNAVLRKQKTSELFLEAFNFVIYPSNWRAITALAEYLVGGDQTLIECNEIIAILKKSNPVPAIRQPNNHPIGMGTWVYN